jgi:pyrroloquinoline quinone biosynthesis protein D
VTVPERPKLVKKARLRWDRIENRPLLVWPERGLSLNASAAAVIALCDGRRTLDDMVRELAQRHPESASILRHDVLAVLSDLSERGLLEEGRP